MKPIASRLYLILVLTGAHVAPTLADDRSSGSGLQTSDSHIPAFVPPLGRRNFRTAMDGPESPELAARQGAEALSAKFAGTTASSINDGVKASSPVPIAETDPPHVVATPTGARSIVLASRQADETRSTKGAKFKRPHNSRSAHRIPRTALRKAQFTDREHSGASAANLAAIGSKVGALELLTNPALWH